MANKSTDPTIWNKEWFMALSPLHKLFIKYIFEMCDNAGVWYINYRLATVHIGKSITEVDIAALGSKVEKIGTDKIFMPWYVNFQCGGPLKITSKWHKSILDLLEKHGLDYRVCNGYIVGIEENTMGIQSHIEEKSKSIRREEKSKEGGLGEISEEPQVVLYPFDDFWIAYAKMEDKAFCKKKWSILSDDDKANIMAHVPKYVAATPDVKYRKLPSTYLNKRTWEDEQLPLPDKTVKKSAIDLLIETGNHGESR